jgi:hypothetical protein
MCTVPNMAAFCSSLMSCSPAVLFGYFVTDFQMVPVTPIVTGISSTEALIRCLCFTFHMRSMHSISIITSFYVTFLSPEIAISINTHVPCPLSPNVGNVHTSRTRSLPTWHTNIHEAHHITPCLARRLTSTAGGPLSTLL